MKTNIGLAVLLVLATTTGSPAQDPPEAPGDPKAQLAADVDRAVDLGLQSLWVGQARDGSWNYTYRDQPYGVGATALILYTEIQCNAALDLNDKAVQKGLEILSLRRPEGTYSMSLSILALSAAIEKAREKKTCGMQIDHWAKRLHELVRRLIELQTSTGGWWYREEEEKKTLEVITVTPPKHQAPPPKPPPKYDLCNTHFALLALRAAKNLSCTVPDSCWKQALALLEKRCAFVSEDCSGWAYAENERPNAVLTVQGIWSWLICKMSLDPKADPDDLLKARSIQMALNFLTGDEDVQGMDRRNRFASAGLPSSSTSIFESWCTGRLCATADLEFLNGEDWYADGAKQIVGMQDQLTGRWDLQYHHPIDTCFAILFLKRINVTRPEAGAKKTSK